VRAIHKRSSPPHAEYSFFDVKHLHMKWLCLLEQAHHKHCSAVAVKTVCVLATAEKAANNLKFSPRRIDPQPVVNLGKLLDVVIPHDSAHHVRADGLVVGTVPLVANSRNAFRSHDRRDPAKKSGTTMRGESSLYRLHGIIGMIGST
jgi:hypothetical protein